MDRETLYKTFSPFAGQEIDIGQGDNDPVITELYNVAAQHDLTVKVWLPGQAGADGYNTSRLNVHVKKDENNKHLIQNLFGLG